MTMTKTIRVQFSTPNLCQQQNFEIKKNELQIAW